MQMAALFHFKAIFMYWNVENKNVAFTFSFMYYLFLNKVFLKSGGNCMKYYIYIFIKYLYFYKKNILIFVFIKH